CARERHDYGGVLPSLDVW
nr:immunoglobulin heavy chain junction region [Macaca mulatta]MOV39181.1 immunoglobulin heavy chain junction region [Macaca mulatta]MOV39666.1 immunoglobulin heavy chain junction region [Macaca mulatta]MOV39710.1 immunoglobulin heavy chain junction region [Macaca mulatta]MOV39920.1 immunoglobulin heavy chain junction region [Macaca mulatta]